MFRVTLGFECSAAAGSGVSRRAEAGGHLQRPRPSPGRFSAAQLGASRGPRSHRLLPGGAAEDTGMIQEVFMFNSQQAVWLLIAVEEKSRLTVLAKHFSKIKVAKCSTLKASHIKQVG